MQSSSAQHTGSVQSNRTTQSDQPNQSDQLSTTSPSEAAVRSARLAEALADISRADQTRATKARGKAMRDSARDELREAALETCDDMLRVEAALDAILTMLDLQGETNPSCIGLHFLLLPVKAQIGSSAGRLNAHL